MSLNSALHAAARGLSANSRSIAVVSSNISNALTDGYGRREVVLSSSASTPGVRVDALLRHSDPVLAHDQRVASAASAGAKAKLTSSQAVSEALGVVTDAGSLFARLQAFEASLIEAASDPSSAVRLENVSATADTLARKINAVSDTISDQRQLADASIADMVETLNTNLTRVVDLNSKIAGKHVADEELAGLMDQRQRALDTISRIVPIRAVPRDNSVIAVTSLGGQPLIDITAVTFAFNAQRQMTPQMTVENGTLSQITLTGSAETTTLVDRLSGGALQAAFELRDADLPGTQDALDQLSWSLVRRLGAAGPDTTLQPGQPGLFTDAGLAGSNQALTGLSSRIALNTTVAPGASTQWKLRDGLGAATQGPVGNASLLHAVAHALADRSPGRTPSQQINDLTADADQTRIRLTDHAEYTAARLATLDQKRGEQAVDTDQEVQNLLALEQAYAANAQVIRVVDELFRLLLQR